MNDPWLYLRVLRHVLVVALLLVVAMSALPRFDGTALERTGRTRRLLPPLPPDPAMPQVTWEALSNADGYEVFSIAPDFAEGGLDRYPLLGRTTVADRATRTALKDALDRAARQSKGWTALCFNPRHGIRVTHGGVATDFVICFQCMQVKVWQGGRQLASFPTDKSAEPLFDGVLTRAGIGLARKSP